MKVLSYIQGLVFMLWAGAALAAPIVDTTENDKWWFSLLMASMGVITVVLGKVKAEIDAERENMLARQKDSTVPPYIPMTMKQWAVMVASQSAVCWMAAAIFYFLGRHWQLGQWMLPATVALAAIGGAKSIEYAMTRIFQK